MNIQSNNRLIAEFMGYTIIQGDVYNIPSDKGIGYVPSMMKYATSWDWLMPVVERIERLGGIDEFTIKYDSVYEVCIEITTALKSWDFWHLRHYKDITKLQATYQAVVEFIEWYNKQINIKKRAV